MKYKYEGMTIIVCDSYEAMSKKAAAIVAAQITLKPECVLGLATGSTPEGMYENLVAMYQKEEIDFGEVISFNLDEYYPIEPRNLQSYAYYMNNRLFDHINVKKENIHVPNGDAEDVSVVCQGYDRMINEAGNMDLQVLGIGNNGHIGFNEPDVHFEAGTHLVTLDEGTIMANARFFKTVDEVPELAISMGIRNIMHSKKILMLVSGSNKAEVLRDMLFEEVTPNLPASILQLHNDVTIIVDEEAATLIIDRLTEVV
jgi:glucosamine-6-phosphate deaminase